METQRLFDLAVLVERLRQVGLRSDTRQYLAANELLLAYAARGRVLHEDPEALASHLGPIFCGSPEELQIFGDQVRAMSRDESTGREYKTVQAVVRRHWRWWTAGTPVVIVAALLLWRFLPYPVHEKSDAPVTAPPVVIPDQVPEPVPTSFVLQPALELDSDTVTSPLEYSSTVEPRLIAWSAAGAGALVLLISWLWQRRRRDYVIRRLPADVSTDRLELHPPTPVFADLPPPVLRRVAAGLRRNRASDALELHIPATVEASARVNGRPMPVFERGSMASEYLALIDRRGEHDHVAQMIHRWIAQLGGRGVVVDCYEFDTDPRVCREYGTPHSHRLASLLARHHKATLLLCADSEVCLDPVRGRPHAWMKAFQALANRVLLTSTPPFHWSTGEHRLLDLGFVVLQSSVSGLRTAAAMEREWRQPANSRFQYAREYPPLLAQSGLRWLDRNAPEPAQAARLLRELEAYLGPFGYSWLGACAIYPQISWSITLTLREAIHQPANNIDAQRVFDEVLPSLARLPWFRYGYMPDWLRRLLISHLAEDQEAAIRRALADMVCGLLEGDAAGASRKGAAPLLLNRRAQALQVAQAAAAESSLQDEVFLDFLAGAAPDALELQVSALRGSGLYRRRGSWTRLLGRWRKLRLHRPWLTRVAASLLVASVAASLVTLEWRRTRMLVEVPAFNETYLLAQAPPTTGSLHAAVARNGDFAVLSVDGQKLVFWDLRKNVAIHELSLDQPVHAIAISPGSDRVAMLDVGGRLHVNTGTDPVSDRWTVTPMMSSAPDQAGRQWQLVFSADSSRLIAYSREGTWMFDVNRRSAMALVHQDVIAAAFDPDDARRYRLATPRLLAAYDSSPRLLLAGETPDSRPLQSVEIDATNASFGLDGRLFAHITGSDSKESRIEIRQGLASQPFRVSGFGEDLAYPTDGWAWSPDQKVLAFTQSANAYRVYDMGAGQMGPLQNPRYEVGLTTVRFERAAHSRETHYVVERHALTIAPEPASALAPAAEEGSFTESSQKKLLLGLVPEVAALAQQLLADAKKRNIQLRVNSGRRTKSQTEDGVAAAQSMHRQGRAFDTVIVDANNRRVAAAEFNEKRKIVGALGEKLGLSWGDTSRRPDYDHFELPAPSQGERASTPPVNKVPPNSPAQVPAQSPVQAPPQARNLQLVRPTFEYDYDGRSGELNIRTEEIRTQSGEILGSFTINLERPNSESGPNSPKTLISALRFRGSGIGDLTLRGEPNQSPARDELDQGTVTFTVEEVAREKTASKTMRAGVLEYTVQLSNLWIGETQGTRGISESELRIRVDVALRPEASRANRPAAK